MAQVEEKTNIMYKNKQRRTSKLKEVSGAKFM